MAPTGYRIQIQGHLDAEWSAWFDGMTVRCHSNGTTTLTGPVRDQAALHGQLLRIRDLGLVLISVNPIELNGDDSLSPSG